MTNLANIPVRQKQRNTVSGKDREYLAKVAELPCVICHHWGLPQMSPTQVHHVIHGRFGTRKVPDAMTIPLCEGHHMGDFDTSKIALHREPKLWKSEYGEDAEWISWTQDQCSKRGQSFLVRGVCKAEGCEDRERFSGYCGPHYRRNLKYGDPLAGGTALGAPMDWLKANKDHEGTECLPWPFSESDGYYSVKLPSGGYSKAHRIMCTLAHGDPKRGHQTRHLCNNKSCVNPKHLRWGTAKENAQDRIKNGTTRNHATLTPEMVSEIRERASNGEAMKAIAKDYPCSYGHVWSIVQGLTWKTGGAP